MVYIASSWRNQRIDGVIAVLKEIGQDYYDFRDPKASFDWADIDKNWESWNCKDFLKARKHPLAIKGFKQDKDALEKCDSLILVLPCGNSAHIELGYAIAKGLKTYVLWEEGSRPDLMYGFVDNIFPDLYSFYDAMKEEICQKK